MESATSIDGNTGYFPSFEVLTNSKMESVVGNDSVNSSSSQQEQNSFDAGLSEAQDALLSIIEQQSNRSPDEYRSALVPFGEILRDIYETSNQTLNLSQQQNNDNPSTTPTVSTDLIEESTNQQQPISTFHLPAPYQQQAQHNQGFSSNYNNTNLMNYLNPFNNSFNFYQNYQQPNNAPFNPIYSAASNSQNNNNNENNNEQQQHQIQQQQNKYDDYNQNIETLIETVYEDENDQNPVYLNFNVSHDGNAATGAVIENSNDNHNIPIQNSNYSVEQLIYPGIYPAGAAPQHQGSTYNNTSVNGKLWYPESIINTGNCNNNDNNFINRNINQQQNYIHPEYHHHRIQNNTNSNIPIRKLSLLHSNQSAFDIYHRNGNNKTPYQKYNNKNKSFIDTTNFHDPHNNINNGYLIKPKNYNHHQQHQQYVHEQFIPIGRNLQLQPNQKFITSDMISCRPPIQTKRTVATTILNNIQQQQQSQQPPHQQQQPQPQLLISSSYIVPPPETCNPNNGDNNNIGAVVGDGVVIKDLTNVDISGIDFSSLDTSDIIIQKVQPKFGEPLHKKRKQDLKILDGSENYIFEFVDFIATQQQQQNDEIYINNNKLINDHHQTDDIQIEKNLKNILNSSYTDDEQDDDNNNNNNFQLNIIKSSTPSPDEIPLSKLKVKKNKINKENLKLPSTLLSSSHQQQHQQQTITNNNNNNIPYKKQKRTLLKKSTKIDCCFNNHDGETSSSAESDFEDMLLKNKSFKCNKCNKMFKSAKTLSTHRKRCNNNNINITEQKKIEHEKIDDEILNKNNNDNHEQHEEQNLKTIVSGGGFDSEHDDDPNSYPVEYLESDTELNDIKNQTINNNNTVTDSIISHNNNNTTNNEEQQQIIKETIETDGLESNNNEDNFRRKTRSQTKRKTVDLNYYEPSQKYPAKRKK